MRFQLDTYSLPSWIPEIETNQNVSVNKMVDSITLQYDTHIVTQNLTWVATNEHINPPSLPVGDSMEYTNEYYYANSFRHYCDLVNTSFVSATNALKILASPTLDDMHPPYMIWNESNHTAELLTEEAYYNQSKAEPVKIFFNRPLYSRFTSLPAIKNFNATNGRNYHITITDDASTKSVLLDIDNNSGTADILYIKTPSRI